ncbi:MAG: hypothetical protein AAGJ37_02590 [Pseudomonadota bacterium]
MNRIEFEPVITQAQIDKKEPDDHGFYRRAMLLLLTQSSQEMRTTFGQSDDSKDALLTAIELTAEYEKHLKALLEMNKSAQARLLIIGQQIAEEEESV